MFGPFHLRYCTIYLTPRYIIYLHLVIILSQYLLINRMNSKIESAVYLIFYTSIYEYCGNNKSPPCKWYYWKLTSVTMLIGVQGTSWKSSYIFLNITIRWKGHAKSYWAGMTSIALISNPNSVLNVISGSVFSFINSQDLGHWQTH